jgi:OOP family OmpA-OmpF porin
MQQLLKRMLLCTTIMLGTIASFAQDSVKVYPANPKLFSGTQGFRVWSIGVTAGGLAPMVVLGGRNDYSKWNTTFGYGAYVKAQLTHNFGLQADFLKGTVSGQNEPTYGNGVPVTDPNKSFSTDINWSATFSGVLTLANISWTQLHTGVQPYIRVGGGVIDYSPHYVNSAGTTVDYSPSGSISKLVIPAGFGFKLNVSNSVNIDLGYTMNFIDGDDFDAYYKPPYSGDKFSYAHAGLEFNLGSSSKPVLAQHNAPHALAQDLWDKNTALQNSLAANNARLDQLNRDMANINALRDSLNSMKLDSDRDGVADYFDKCPNTPAGTKVDGSGCALPAPPPPQQSADTTIIQKFYITEEDKRIVSEAMRNIEFDFGKATIRARSLPYLDRVAAMLKQKGFSLKLAGHTDNVGSDAANLRLSKSRAESVKSYLVSQGVNSGRVEAVGYGESQPIATNKTDAGRQKNRRVEFTLF